MAILSAGTDAKTVKGEAFGYRTFISYLAPAMESGYQTCASASVGCADACLFTAGRGAMRNVRDARVAKTLRFFQERTNYMAELVSEVGSAIRNTADMIPAFRLNGTSDIRWETVPVLRNGEVFGNIMEAFPGAIWYDYTKHANRRDIPANYHLTMSRSETNEREVLRWLENGGNAAVVFRNRLPETWNGFQVIDGDVSDLRFLDPKNVVVGLKAKGRAKLDRSGFVVD